MRFNRESPWIPIVIAIFGIGLVLPAGGTRAQPIGVDIAAFGLGIVVWLYGCTWVDGDPAKRRDTFLGGIIRYAWCGLIPWALRIVQRIGWRA